MRIPKKRDAKKIDKGISLPIEKCPNTQFGNGWINNKLTQKLGEFNIASKCRDQLNANSTMPP